MACVGAVEHAGVPLNGAVVDRLKSRWPDVVDLLIDNNRNYESLKKDRLLCNFEVKNL